jgi:AAA domain, putative AbiEii toxin, Type IV TA system
MCASSQIVAQLVGDKGGLSERELSPNTKSAKRKRKGNSQMITQVTIRNFRCFKLLEVKGLKQINLVVGKNSSGKTAFVESIFICSGPGGPTVALQMRGIRRMGNQYSVTPEEHYYRGMWEDLFYDFKDQNKISIKLLGNPASDERTLTVEYGEKSTQETPLNKERLISGNNLSIASTPQIVFTWKRQGYPAFVARPKFVGNGIQYETSDVPYFPSLWFTPGVAEGAEEIAKRFSEIDKRGDLPPVLEAFKAEFPFVTGLSIQYFSGFPMVFASVEGRSKKMPVPLISDGVSRLLSILVGIAYMKGGAVLIDQLEDGFHYTLLPSIWATLHSFAILFKVQLFVTTHSRECIDAMLPVIEKNEGDFALLVAGQNKSGEATVRSVEGKLFKSSISQGFDLR